MEEYDRNSLRRLRKEALEHQHTGQKGSRFISMLIVLMFLLAGGFYIKTTDPIWLTGNPSYIAVREKLEDWKEALVSAFQGDEEINDVQETVNAALAQNDEV